MLITLIRDWNISWCMNGVLNQTYPKTISPTPKKKNENILWNCFYKKGLIFKPIIVPWFMHEKITFLLQCGYTFSQIWLLVEIE